MKSNLDIVIDNLKFIRQPSKRKRWTARFAGHTLKVFRPDGSKAYCRQMKNEQAARDFCKQLGIKLSVN